MANVQPFKALRPRPELAKAVASPPYDVLNSKEAAAAAAGNPHSFLHVTKSEIDLPHVEDIHTTIVYEQAKKNLEQLITDGVLFREETACYYIYELIMNGRHQTGIVAVSSVDDYEQNVILKHEFTRPEKEQDRINHIRTSGAQTGNVFLAYRDVAEINSLVESWKQQHPPAYQFEADDRIGHAIWVVNDAATVSRIQELFATAVPKTYIADGHHRAASAAKVRKSLPTNHHDHANYFLTTLFPAGQLHIMDYNRVVKDLNGHTPAEVLKALYKQFDVERMPAAFSPTQLHAFGMYLDGQWYQLVAKPGTYTEDPIGVLDVTILQQHILEPIFGIVDQRTDKRIDFVGGIRGLGALEQRVDSGEMAVAFSLHPVSIQQLFDISDSGEVMPPKSTWFEPKLRDGLLTHLIHS